MVIHGLIMVELTGRDNRKPVLTLCLGMSGSCKYNAAKPQSFLHMEKSDFCFLTLVSYQWVFGPSYFVEYLTRELPCTKSPETVCVLQLPDSPVSIPECLHNLRFVFTDHLYVLLNTNCVWGVMHETLFFPSRSNWLFRDCAGPGAIIFDCKCNFHQQCYVFA